MKYERRPKPDDAALCVAIAHLQRDVDVAANNADVAIKEKRMTDATGLETNRDRLLWVIDLLNWRRLTDLNVMMRMEAKADAEALAYARGAAALAETKREALREVIWRVDTANAAQRRSSGGDA